MPRQHRAGRQDAGKPGQTNTPSVKAETDRGERNDPPAGSKRPAPGLHVVATPIGNAHDISTPLLAYHEHNAARMRPLLLERLRRGEVVALVSDAGTPLVSDPGFKLVREAIAEHLPVTTLPGPSAALAALVLSGLPSDRFLFAGFLPPKAAARRRTLTELAAVPATLVFFEGTSRLADALGDMAETLGDRPAAVAREITKLYEEVRRGALG